MTRPYVPLKVAMRFILVVQLKPDSLSDLFIDLSTLEVAIEKCLGETDVIDGNDIGVDEANLFVVTEDPESLFCRFKSSSHFSRWKERVHAAYREDDSDD